MSACSVCFGASGCPLGSAERAAHSASRSTYCATGSRNSKRAGAPAARSLRFKRPAYLGHFSREGVPPTPKCGKNIASGAPLLLSHPSPQRTGTGLQLTRANRSRGDRGNDARRTRRGADGAARLAGRGADVVGETGGEAVPVTTTKNASVEYDVRGAGPSLVLDRTSTRLNSSHA